MSLLTRGQAEMFRSLSREKQRQLIESMSPSEVLAFDAAFEIYAREGQWPPDGDGWRVWLMMAGRGFGKTRAGAEWVHGLASQRGLRIALVAASIDEARSVMVEGASGLLAVARAHGVKLKWEPSRKQLTWPSGSIAQLYSGDHADGLRGPQHHFAWLDEVDSPPDPSVQGYRVRIAGASEVIERDCGEEQASFSAADVASLGSGPIEVHVRQVGTLALSRPETNLINL